MSPTHIRQGGRLYRYYVSQTVLEQGRDTCPVRRLPAAEIEQAVIDKLRHLIGTPEIIAATWKAAREHDGEIAEEDVRASLDDLDPLWDELSGRAGPHRPTAGRAG